jgi:Flp pilus assembly protein TadG
MKLLNRGKRRHNENGQTLPMFAFFLVVIILFVGLAVDFGFAYLTKASLSKAVDAACLAGIRGLPQGQAEAETSARSAFALNYTSPATVDVSFSTDSNGNPLLSVTANKTINTFFIRILPEWTTLNVGASAQATRAKVVMTLVLDRSGSMQDNQGWRELAPAVDNFVDNFDDSLDRVAMASFASHARTDVTMTHDFKTPIKNAVLRNKTDYNGGTFANGGLQIAQTQNDSVAVAAGDNAVKVTVFFTDGLANIIQQNLACSPAPIVWNFGGFDSGGQVDFFNKNTGQDICSTNGASGVVPCCTGVYKFTSAIDGMDTPFNRNQVTRDAVYQSLETAKAMRAEGTIVYSIGLGDNVDKDFLMQIANDPNSSTFDRSQPAGEFLYAPDASDLQGVFQKLAAKILLRLTQ